ncbi:MAG: hypothetical protein NTX59_04485 [Elusimicrobia bacterium]|nr:hypothetical protein [Elusimicrobiota bacterium]
MNTRRFWIRKDREQYLLSGVIITCVIGSFVSAYWHFSDRTQVKREIRVKASAPKETMKRLKEVQFSAQKLKIGNTSYYKIDSDTRHVIPKLGEEDGN